MHTDMGFIYSVTCRFLYLKTVQMYGLTVMYLPSMPMVRVLSLPVCLRMHLPMMVSCGATRCMTGRPCRRLTTPGGQTVFAPTSAFLIWYASIISAASRPVGKYQRPQVLPKPVSGLKHLVLNYLKKSSSDLPICHWWQKIWVSSQKRLINSENSFRYRV